MLIGQLKAVKSAYQRKSRSDGNANISDTEVACAANLNVESCLLSQNPHYNP